MARANRYITEGRHYHITHRCHDRAFLLKFVKDRNAYRRLLREELAAAGPSLALLGYCITSNHVHLLFTVHEREALVNLMQSVEGKFAQDYNRRRKRTGAFWGDRYHATLVDSEVYLVRCLRYIDLNMVRAGVVEHPADWEWCGYREIAGLRRRYRMIDQTGLIDAADAEGDETLFVEHYRAFVDEAIAERAMQREAMWTESLAVGRREFVERMERTIRNRRRLERIEGDGCANGAGEEPWILRETPDRDAASTWSQD